MVYTASTVCPSAVSYTHPLLHPFALLTFNVRNPIFRSPEVRKALAMSIDNKALAQAVPGGVRPMYGPIPPGSEWHSPVSTPYDPDEMCIRDSLKPKLKLRRTKLVLDAAEMGRQFLDQ